VTTLPAHVRYHTGAWNPHWAGLPLRCERLLLGVGGTSEYWLWSGQSQTGAWNSELRPMSLSAVRGCAGVAGSVGYMIGGDRNAQLV